MTRVALTMTDRIADLAGESVPDLRTRWDVAFGHPAPRRTSRDLLLRALAYHIQATAHGGLRKATQKHLARLAAGDDLSRRVRKRPAVRLKPGSRLIREWGGRVHQVTVLDRGFDYGGAHYRSLSHVARTITGTRWSGPAFFGLRGRSSGGNHHGL